VKHRTDKKEKKEKFRCSWDENGANLCAVSSDVVKIVLAKEKRCHVNTVFYCYMHVFPKLIFYPVKLLLFRFSRISSRKVTERVPRKVDLNLESLSSFWKALLRVHLID
jgi:hypothetical protein